MSAPHPPTHRCQGSLDARCPIRHEGACWWLYRLDVDFDWDWVGILRVVPIEWCPFCGVRLP